MRVAAQVPLTCTVVLAVAAPAVAAPRAITGKLDTPGYTLIALSPAGKAKSVRAGRSTFRLRPPAKTVTLHLRDRQGVYAGPVVVGGAGSRVIVGVRVGARLGLIRVHHGYARVALRPVWQDRTRWAKARAGVPLGARVFGRVRIKPRRGAVLGDLDIDGIPDRVDIDDDGDRVLDKLDRSRRARAAQSPGHQDPFDLASNLGAIPLDQTANVNAGSTDGQIDAALPAFGWIAMASPKADSVELDCGGTPNPSPPPPLVGGLPYCSYGGTGRVADRRGPAAVFPECCDADGDGLGSLVTTVVGPDFTGFHLDHHATAAQIGTGDTLILRIVDNGQETQLTDTQQFIFATVPALASFVDEAGTQTVVPYPVPEGAPGTTGNGFPVADGPDADSDIEVTVTLWRPQRRPTSEAECAQPAPGCTQTEWIDIGGLDYTASTATGVEKINDAAWCAQDAFSDLDSGLAAGFYDPQGGGFRDLAPARPANRANTFTFRLNLTKCLDRYDISFPPGRSEDFRFEAFTPIKDGSAGVDNASTQVAFKRR